jgi:hypothetical protein
MTTFLDDSSRYSIRGAGRLSYSEFLAARAQHADGTGFEPTWLPDALFPFQRHLTTWTIKQGRAATLADCGLGKGLMALTWAENVRRHVGRPVLVVAPLAVTIQLAAEAEKFGFDAAVSRDGTPAAGITITNYDRLSRFDTTVFGGVVCDEASAIKAFDGQLRALVTEFLRAHPYRLLCTATAAPNDYTELGTLSEALGHLGYIDMLNRFFTNRQRTSSMTRGYFGTDQGWRFKGHAEQPFWRFVASWARAIRRPSDLGFSDNGFVLPPLEYRTHTVKARTHAEGALFDVPAVGLREEREETRRTLTERCEAAAALLTGPDLAVAWCLLNDESALLTHLIPDAVEVAGADSPEAKEEKLIAFSRGEIPVLVTKPAIGAWGLNWQHCHRMTYFPNHSYEQMYQAVRRCWRFGQILPVTVDLVTTEGGANAVKSLERKAAQADAMFDALVTHMRDADAPMSGVFYDQEVRVPSWV